MPKFETCNSFYFYIKDGTKLTSAFGIQKSTSLSCHEQNSYSEGELPVLATLVLRSSMAD